VSLSHTRRAAVIAVVDDGWTVGVDVESVGERPAWRNAAAARRAAASGRPEGPPDVEPWPAFLRAWVRDEAGFKALGRRPGTAGLPAGARSITWLVGASGTPIAAGAGDGAPMPDPSSDAPVAAFPAASTHLVSVVVARPHRGDA
jgi:hypothetical protein